VIRRFLAVCVLLLASGSVAGEQSSKALWVSALDRIESLYLWRDALEASDLLAEAAEYLEKRVEWLVVERLEDRVLLYQGDGEYLGDVSATSLEGLPHALQQVRSMVESVDAPLNDDLDLEVALLKGLVGGLDRHSRVLHGERLASFDKRLSGTLSGIGTRISMIEHRLTVVEVYPNTPASRGGVQRLDRIVRIDGIATMGMNISDAVGRITGERGTKVVLSVERELDGGVIKKDLPLVRARVKIPNVVWRELSPGYGYIEIDHFSEQTVSNLRRAMQDLSSKGALDKGLVLDLRENTGGSMIQAARAADLFVSEGELVSTVGPGGAPVRGLVPSINALDDGRDRDVPLVVLQDRRTASGSEIVAGTLRELDRTILIGETSYGKGTVQKVYTLRKDVRLKLTVARYLLNGGLGITEEGLEPDVPLAYVHLGDHGMAVGGEHGASGALMLAHESGGWAVTDTAANQRELESREDVPLGIATRILEHASAMDASTRAELLEAAESVVRAVRVEEEERLVESMAAGGFDWKTSSSLGPIAVPELDVVLRVEGEAVAGGQVRVVADVTNRGPEVLERMQLRLSAPGAAWDGKRIPIGRLNPGETRMGQVPVSIPIWTQSRGADVEVYMECQGVSPRVLARQVLNYEGTGRADIGLTVSLKSADDLDPGLTRAEVGVRNDSPGTLEDVRVRILFPESAGIELTEYDVGVEKLEPGETADLALGLKILSEPGPVPLHFRVTAAGFGRLASWSTDMVRGGPTVRLSSPRITILNPTLHAGVGKYDLGVRVSDDSRVEHVEVWYKDEKVGYAQGSGPLVDVNLQLTLDSGENRFTVRAFDDQNLLGRASWTVRGVPDSDPTTDAIP